MARHGRLDKANRFTWTLPFATLALKPILNMDQKLV